MTRSRIHDFFSCGRFFQIVGAVLITVAGNVMVASGAETPFKLLYVFDSPASPVGNLVLDAAGNLYGVTTTGGQGTCNNGAGCGTVFKLAPGGTERVLYSFAGGTDGASPAAGLVFDRAGNLYGTTAYGGSCGMGSFGCGTVFELTPNPDGSWTKILLHTFGWGGAEVSHPGGSLIFDPAGNLYGTAWFGGTTYNGGVFKLAPNPDGTWTECTVYSIGNRPTGALALDAAGNLYGVTQDGGDGGTACWGGGCGTVFKLTPQPDVTWALSVLYNFTGGSDGTLPVGDMVLDAVGNLYGTTGNGCGWEPGGCGNVFKLAPNPDGTWTESVLHDFTGGADGDGPPGGVIFDASGNLYGTASFDGSSGYGVVFKLTPNSDGTWTETVLHSFDDNPAATPSGRLVFDNSGNLYGNAQGDGTTTFGAVFEITPASAVTFTPSSLTFAAQPVGTFSQSQPVTLTNTGGATLNISTINWATGDFYQSNNCRHTLLPQASCTLNVMFTPTAAGSRSGGVKVWDNAAGSPQKLPLKGSGSGTGSIILTLSPATLDFGDVKVGTTSNPQTATVTNVGSAAANFEAPFGFQTGGSDCSDFQFNSQCGTSLGPDASCAVTVTFTPKASGARTGSFGVRQGAHTVSIPLSGTGTP